MIEKIMIVKPKIKYMNGSKQIYIGHLFTKFV